MKVLYNLAQNILKKNEKLNEVTQKRKTLISELVYLLSTSAKTPFFCRGGWTLDCVTMHFWDFSSISIFYKMLSLKSFGNSRCTLYIKLLISNSVLLVMNADCAKTSQNSQILWTRLLIIDSSANQKLRKARVTVRSNQCDSFTERFFWSTFSNLLFLFTDSSLTIKTYSPSFSSIQSIRKGNTLIYIYIYMYIYMYIW